MSTITDGVVSLLDTVGNTPLVEVPSRVFPEETQKNNAKILVKMEMQNPGGSVKDRIALNMIETMEKQGLIKEDTVLVEYTSGNTGIGLAMVRCLFIYLGIAMMSISLFVSTPIYICRSNILVSNSPLTNVATFI